MKTVLFEDLVEQKIDNRGKTPPLSENGYPLLEVNAISKKSIYPDPAKARKYVDQKTWDNWFRQHLEKDDIIFTTVGTIAESAIVPQNPGYAIAQNILGFRFRRNEIDPLYALYLMRSKWFLDQIYGRTIETVQKSIKWSDIRGIKVPLPSIDEQESIAVFVNHIDEKIELNRQMNETLEQIGQTLFKHYFIDNPESKAWPKKKLGEMIEVTDYVANGSFASLKQNVNLKDNEDYAIYIRTTDYKNGFSGKLKYVDERSYEFLAKSRMHGDEIIISNVGDVGTVFRPPSWLNKPMTLGSNTVMIKPSIYNNFLYLHFKSQSGQFEISNITAGSAQPKFNKTEMRNLKIVCPDEKTLKDFNDNYDVLRSTEVNNHSENKSLTILRDSLLPRLISGKIKI